MFSQVSVCPHHTQGGTPSRRLGEYPFPGQDGGGGYPPSQVRMEVPPCGCWKGGGRGTPVETGSGYSLGMDGGMPLAFTQEDFLVLGLFTEEFSLSSLWVKFTVQEIVLGNITQKKVGIALCMPWNWEMCQLCDFYFCWYTIEDVSQFTSYLLTLYPDMYLVCAGYCRNDTYLRRWSFVWTLLQKYLGSH